MKILVERQLLDSGKKAMTINITNCNFWYPSCYAHMLGEINRGSPINTINDEKFETNTNVKNCTGCIIERCVFKYVDGAVMDITGGNNTLIDNYIAYVDKTVCNLSSVMTT